MKNFSAKAQINSVSLPDFKSLSNTLPYILSVIISLLFGAQIIKKLVQKSKTNRFPPGPRKSDETLGNLVDMGKAGSLHEYCKELSEKFGPIFSFWWGTSRVVGIADPEAMKSLKKIFDRPPSLFMGFSPLIGKNSVQYANKQEGKTRHRVLTHSFTNKMIKSFFEKLVKIGEAKIADLKRMKRGKLEINVERITMDMAIQGIVQSGFGGVSEKDVLSITNSYHILWDTMEQKILAGAEVTAEDKAFHTNREMLTDFVKQFTKKLEGNREGNAIERLIAEPLYDEDKILADGITVMVGGFHTTGTMMQWVLFYLARDQKIQSRLLNEVNSVVEKGMPPSFEQIKNMKLLQNIIYETLRVAAVAPWGARVAEETLDIMGYKVPAGMPVITCFGVILQSRKFWKNPERFDPDRFDREDSSIKKFGKNVFMPFGGSGGRKCPGYRLTMMEGGLWIAMLVRAFEFHLVTDKDPGITYGLVSKPTDEVIVRLVPRD